MYVTLSTNDIQHNNALHYAHCCYAEYHIIINVMLNVLC
jgi:hypothetical protein